MKKERTHYDKTFKEDAVKLSLERKNVSELAQELGGDVLCFESIAGLLLPMAQSAGRKA